MQMVIHPGKLKGSITPPPSKSMMQRACAGALLHGGTTVITNPGYSEDDKAALAIISQLGAEVRSIDDRNIEITSSGIVRASGVIDCSESGLSARLFTPIAALSASPVTITGKEGLRRRPMTDFGDVLPKLGVKLSRFDGYLPVTVKGPIQPKSFTMDASLSSQFLSGLLFALSAVAKRRIQVKVTELNSKAYVDMTLEVLSMFGKKIEREDYRVFCIDPVRFTHEEEVRVNIEADWSSAAYWLVGAAISGSVTVANLNIHSLQADRAITDVLRQCGANIEADGDHVTVSSSPLRAFKFDATDCPDLFPVLSILASCCDGESQIKGLERLVHKESNRVESISAMLESFGVTYKVEGNGMVIKGQEELKACAIEGYNDHRIVMAAAIGALRATGPVSEEGAPAVAKSYPLFFNHLASLGIHTSTIS